MRAANSNKAKLSFFRRRRPQHNNSRFRMTNRQRRTGQLFRGLAQQGPFMVTKYFLPLCFFAGLIFASQTCATQEREPDIHVIVNMVQLNVAVTDNKGRYVTNLRPEDFAITEDGIKQK